MKIALVTSFPAFPATAGNRSRIQELARAVMQLGHELTFVLLPGEHEYADDAAHQAAFGKERYVKVTGGQVGPNWPGKWTLQQIGKGFGVLAEWMSRNQVGRQAVRRIVSGKHTLFRLVGLEGTYYSSLDRFYDSTWAKQLVAVGRDVDAVIVEYVFYSWAFQCFPESALRLLDTHDAFADRHHSYVAQGVSNYWISLRPRDENAGFRRADAIFAIQQEEAHRFRRQLATDGAYRDPDVVVVSHFLRQGASPVQCEAANAAIFLASDNPANRHAVDSFIQNVLPLVLREVPDFELKLAGSICSYVPDSPNVKKLGWVEDVQAVFAQAAMSVNPILVGTGINIKLLEAMAAGVPTVSTATGIRGLPPSYRNGILAAADDDYEAFASLIIRVLNDAKLREGVARAAFEDAKRWNAEQVSALNRCLTKRGERARPTTQWAEETEGLKRVLPPGVSS